MQYTENDLFVHSALNTQETNVVGKHTGNSAMRTHSAEKEQTIAQIVNWKMGVHNVYYTSIRTKELLFDHHTHYKGKEGKLYPKMLTQTQMH